MEAGADVTIPTAGRESGITPLHLAVAAPAVSSTQDATPEEMAELLLEKGADVDARFRIILLTKKKVVLFLVFLVSGTFSCAPRCGTQPSTAGPGWRR